MPESTVSYLIPPGLLFLGAAALIPVLQGRARQVFMLAFPLAMLVYLALLPGDNALAFTVLGRYNLAPLTVTPLRMCFGYVFTVFCFLATLYALHVGKSGHHAAVFALVGCSLGVVFAGDYLTLFVFWELMAVSCMFIIWNRGTHAARRAGYRYALVHIASGAVLLAGIMLQVLASGSIALTPPQPGLGFYLILIGVATNAAIPPLSAWLPDAYPQATPFGTVALGAYTTKTAVLVLVLLFSGTHLLVWAGVIMALYGILFTLLENDIRRLLAYHIISQVGYMVCGVGLGSELAINGVTAHALNNIIYKGLLFMGAGAVIHATGRRRLTELGGLYRALPIVLLLYTVGSFSISGVPGFNGFISKGIIISAATHLHMPGVELLLTLAAIGTFLSTGLKLPYFTFFGPRRDLPARPLPCNMLWAMWGTALLCITFGVAPGLLYGLLPNQMAYQAFTLDHVISAVQLLIATALVFVVLRGRLGGYPAVTLDTDWFYRKGGAMVVWLSAGPLERLGAIMGRLVSRGLDALAQIIRQPARVIERLAPMGQGDAPLPLHIKERIGIGVAVAMGVFVLYVFLQWTTTGH